MRDNGGHIAVEKIQNPVMHSLETRSQFINLVSKQISLRATKFMPLLPQTLQSGQALQLCLGRDAIQPFEERSATILLLVKNDFGSRHDAVLPNLRTPVNDRYFPATVQSPIRRTAEMDLTQRSQSRKDSATFLTFAALRLCVRPQASVCSACSVGGHRRPSGVREGRAGRRGASEGDWRDGEAPWLGSGACLAVTSFGGVWDAMGFIREKSAWQEHGRAGNITSFTS
jgi:hypothetical protein